MDTMISPDFFFFFFLGWITIRADDDMVKFGPVGERDCAIGASARVGRGVKGKVPLWIDTRGRPDSLAVDSK